MMSTVKSSPTASAPGYTIADAPLTWRHWWIAVVASLGQMIGTMVATVAGVIIPLMALTSTYAHMSSLVQGLIGAADLIGIMVGSMVFGRLSDRYGYLPFFRFCPALVLVASLIAVFVPDVWVLIISLFVVGFGIGGEYSLDSDYTSELMPARYQLLMLGIVKSGAAFGNILGAGISFLLVAGWSNPANWPQLMWTIAVVAAIMLLSRIYFFESPKWLLCHGEKSKAVIALHRFLGPSVGFSAAELNPQPKQTTSGAAEQSPSRLGFFSFCRRYWDKVVLSGIPWSCEGLGVYGIGVFIPILVMALGIEHQSASATAIAGVASSVKTTMWISCIILPGFLIGVWLASHRVREVRLQSVCFWACAASLLILLFSYHLKWPVWISLISFMAFELFLNIGPHLVTYLLPPRIYPVEVRGQGTGIAAAIGKAGAVAGVFLVPLLLKAGGGVLVLAFSAVIMAIGAIVTGIYGRRVEKLSDTKI